MKSTGKIIIFIITLLALADSAYAANDPGQELADAQGLTPLHIAANNGRKAEVEALLAKGASINAQDKDGKTPLHHAAFMDRKDVAEVLIAKGADINSRNQNGDTPLHLAARDGNKNTAELLLIKGANVNAKRNDGETPLHAAAEGKRDIAELLLIKGADINARDQYGWTPLHSAANSVQKDIVELLLAKGADINAKSTKGLTPLLNVGLSQGAKDVIELLLAKGADVNAKDESGFTKLHSAAYLGQKDIVELLLAKGADVNAKDKDGKTPLYFAVAQGKKDVAELLERVVPKAMGNPRELFAQLLAELKGNANNEKLRKSVIEASLKLQPGPAIPAQAEQFEGRAQYAYKNAKSEAEKLDSAREYLKAVDAAPWVAGYYFDLCTILENANRPAEAIRACKLYLTAAPEATDASDTRKRIAGLEYAVERQLNNVTRRHDCGTIMSDIYENGAKVAWIGASKISVKLISSLYGGVWRNQLFISDITTLPQNIIGQRKELNPIDTTFQLEDRVQGTPYYRWTIASDGRITFGGYGSAQAEIVTSIAELHQLRNAQLSDCEIAAKNGKFFVTLGQGGGLRTNDGALVNGRLFFESDCAGNLLGEKPGVLPMGLDPHPETPGVNRQQSNWYSESFSPASADACRQLSNDGLGWLAP